MRDRYGRDLFGQSLLMGRRMVEAGARFVTVAWDMAIRGDDTSSWDSHRSLTRVMKNHLLPGLDRSLPVLLKDLEVPLAFLDRGLPRGGDSEDLPLQGYVPPRPLLRLPPRRLLPGLDVMPDDLLKPLVLEMLPVSFHQR